MLTKRNTPAYVAPFITAFMMLVYAQSTLYASYINHGTK
jgi:hypothetical protein